MPSEDDDIPQLIPVDNFPTIYAIRPSPEFNAPPSFFGPPLLTFIFPRLNHSRDSLHALVGTQHAGFTVATVRLYPDDISISVDVGDEPPLLTEYIRLHTALLVALSDAQDASQDFGDPQPQESACRRG